MAWLSGIDGAAAARVYRARREVPARVAHAAPGAPAAPLRRGFSA